MFDSIYIYVPEKKQIVKIAEGCGDMLTDEDFDAGYVDYIYYDIYIMDPELREGDGGMVMISAPFQHMFTCTKDAIPYVLDMAYCDESLEYIVLN